MKTKVCTDSFDKKKNNIEALSDSTNPIMFPVHPPTKNPLHESRSPERMPGNVRLIKPLGYLDMLMLMADARKIRTDSGGIQKKKYMLGVPCTRLRENTMCRGMLKKISVRGAGSDARRGGLVKHQAYTYTIWRTCMKPWYPMVF